MAVLSPWPCVCICSVRVTSSPTRQMHLVSAGSAQKLLLSEQCQLRGLFGRLNNVQSVPFVQSSLSVSMPMETGFLIKMGLQITHGGGKRRAVYLYRGRIVKPNNWVESGEGMEFQQQIGKICYNGLLCRLLTHRRSFVSGRYRISRLERKKRTLCRLSSCQLQVSENSLVPISNEETSKKPERRAPMFVIGLRQLRRREGTLVPVRFKRHAAVRFVGTINNHWGHYSCLSRRFWTWCTRPSRKQQVDVIKMGFKRQSRLQDKSECESRNQRKENMENAGAMVNNESGKLESAACLCVPVQDCRGRSSTKENTTTTDIAVDAVSTAPTAEASNGIKATEVPYAKEGEKRLLSQQKVGGGPDNSGSVLQNKAFLRAVANAVDAESALGILADKAVEGGTVSREECSELILAALAANNAGLAFSILNAMRRTLIHKRMNMDLGVTKSGWRWSQPDVGTYTTLVRGLALSLHVSDAIRAVSDLRNYGIPFGDEVCFGKVVSCPTCNIALAVIQPQNGIQLVPCFKCRYQYELMSGDVVSSESESISMDISIFEKGLRALQIMKKPLPAAVHSIVVRAPNGFTRTHRFATASANVPAQEGERVTVASAAPNLAVRGFGPFKWNARVPGKQPSEPMSIINHVTGCVSPLLCAPPNTSSGAAFDTSLIIPGAFLLASSDLATALINPTLPRMLAVGIASAIAFGAFANTLILSRLNQLPQRCVDTAVLKQQLLAQYELLQKRIQNLTQATTEEVRMLARIYQLQNKMEAVGKPIYSAQIKRVCKSREGLDKRLAARLELLDSYSKISSMIEIEVEMNSDVLAAEDSGAAANIAQQLEQLMEVEDLQKQWALQAEASDEVERLLRSSPLFPNSI